ncbi:MAG: hypothetical protein F4Y40_04500 [Acidimicrobiia bacterium]|nr:hypothetical protein [Acidimicrobiia bacterium]MYF83947.1 hypothetical protein [Acidimicrobiia bacterium]
MMTTGSRRRGLAILAATLLLSTVALLPAGAQYYPPGPPGNGVVISDDGLVLPVREIRDDGYVVTTTCWNEAMVTGGTYISHVEVVIDPGHGGSEYGAVGSNGLTEKALNLDVSELLIEELRDRGFNAMMTRTTDVRIPIVVRAEIARALKPDVFISLHHNGGATARSALPGTETYHQIEGANSKRLAGILFEELQGAFSQYDVAWRKTVFQGASSVLRVEVQDDLYGILQYTPGIATVITEAAYLSTPAEARLLADPEVQRVEAVAIADGIERYLTTSDPGSGFNPMFSTSRKLSAGGPGGCRDAELGDLGVDEPGFDDVADGSHRQDIDALRDKGILDGTECVPDLFCPRQPIKRWMMAVWLVRALDGADPDPVTESRFADAGADRWWTPYVERLAELEVTRGCDTAPARFCPYDRVTRGQMASFLKRAFDLPEGLSSGFTDIAGSSHAEAIDAVAAPGITRGCLVFPSRYCPNANTSKGQMATLLARALNLDPRAPTYGSVG